MENEKLNGELRMQNGELNVQIRLADLILIYFAFAKIVPIILHSPLKILSRALCISHKNSIGFL